MKNKKALTFGIWIEMILFVVLFVAALAIISTSMNSTYNDNQDLTGGLSELSNDTLNDLIDFQTNIGSNINNGTTDYSSDGTLTFSKTAKIIWASMDLIWGFTSGRWIASLVGLMHLGDFANILIIIFRILYFIAVIFILIKIVTKVIP